MDGVIKHGIVDAVDQIFGTWNEFATRAKRYGQSGECAAAARSFIDTASERVAPEISCVPSVPCRPDPSGYELSDPSAT